MIHVLIYPRTIPPKLMSLRETKDQQEKKKMQPPPLLLFQTHDGITSLQRKKKINSEAVAKREAEIAEVRSLE